MSNAKSIVTGILVGGALGATITLLTTPTSGRNIRHYVKEQGNEWIKTAEEIIQNGIRLKDQIAKTSKEGVALINELTEDMKVSIEEWKTAVEPHQASIHDYLEQIEASIKDLEEKISEQNKQTE